MSTPPTLYFRDPLRMPTETAAKQEMILILDFGSQYTQLIARRVREHKVYCEIVPFDTDLSAYADRQVRGYILSGGPSSRWSPSC